MVRNHGRVVTRTRLMKALWDDERFVDDNTLTVNINRLRRKLETVGLKDYIKTIKGEGHRLTVESKYGQYTIFNLTFTQNNTMYSMTRM